MIKESILALMLITSPAFANNTTNFGLTIMPEVFINETHDVLYNLCGLEISDKMQQKLDSMVPVLVPRIPEEARVAMFGMGIDIKDFVNEVGSRLLTAEIHGVAKEKNEDVCVTLKRNNDK